MIWICALGDNTALPQKSSSGRHRRAVAVQDVIGGLPKELLGAKGGRVFGGGLSGIGHTSRIM